MYVIECRLAAFSKTFIGGYVDSSMNLQVRQIQSALACNDVVIQQQIWLEAYIF